MTSIQPKMDTVVLNSQNNEQGNLLKSGTP